MRARVCMCVCVCVIKQAITHTHPQGACRAFREPRRPNQGTGPLQVRVQVCAWGLLKRTKRRRPNAATEAQSHQDRHGKGRCSGGPSRIGGTQIPLSSSHATRMTPKPTPPITRRGLSTSKRHDGPQSSAHASQESQGPSPPPQFPKRTAQARSN